MFASYGERRDYGQGALRLAGILMIAAGAMFLGHWLINSGEAVRDAGNAMVETRLSVLEEKAIPQQKAAPQIIETPAQQARKRLAQEQKSFTAAGLANAAAANDQKLVQLYLDAGMDVNAAEQNGFTALHAAAAANRPAMIELLVKHGAVLEQKDQNGRTPLITAIATGSQEAAANLLEQGADVTALDEKGHTSLHYAALAAKPDLFQLLLKHGADPNSECCETTPLAHALERRDAAATETLLKLASTPLKWTSQTREALFVAIRARDREMAKTLISAHTEPPTLGAGKQPLIAYAVAWNDQEQIRFLLEAGVNPEVKLQAPAEKEFAQLIPDKVFSHYLQSEEGLTPLMLAAAMGNLDGVIELMAYGAKPGAVTKRYKLAALTFAAKKGHVEIQRVLLGKSPVPQFSEYQVEISLSAQKARITKSGLVFMSTPISSGRPDFPTPTGKFVVTDKHRVRTSTIYEVPMPFFMRLSCSEVGMHQGELPGYPASHGCIRMPKNAVMELFKKLPVGTLVTINP